MFENKLEFKGAVIGMVLGDGCIPKGRKSKHLQIAHKSSDREYVEYKESILKYLTDVNKRDCVSVLNGREYPNITLRTLSHPLYNKIFDHMYFQGRKTVDEHVMKCLTPLGLALWYFDDGTLAGEQGWRNPFICTHNFNKVENELMCRSLHKKFGITFRTIKKNVGKTTYYWMRLRRKDREKFFDIINPYKVDCMERKINPDFYESDARYIKQKKEKCEICGDLFLCNEKSSRFNCDDCNKKNLRKAHTLYYEEKKQGRKDHCVQCKKAFFRNAGKSTTHCSRLCAGITHSNMWKNKRSDQVQT